MYITLSDKPYAYGKDLDDTRRIDYASDGTAIGIELLFPSRGIKLSGLPLNPDDSSTFQRDYKFPVRA